MLSGAAPGRIRIPADAAGRIRVPRRSQLPESFQPRARETSELARFSREPGEMNLPACRTSTSSRTCRWRIEFHTAPSRRGEASAERGHAGSWAGEQPHGRGEWEGVGRLLPLADRLVQLAHDLHFL
jgi:hypothetical protein